MEEIIMFLFLTLEIMVPVMLVGMATILLWPFIQRLEDKHDIPKDILPWADEENELD